MEQKEHFLFERDGKVLVCYVSPDTVSTSLYGSLKDKGDAIAQDPMVSKAVKRREIVPASEVDKKIAEIRAAWV